MNPPFSLRLWLRDLRCRVFGHRDDGLSVPTSRMFTCRRCLRGVNR